MVHSNTTCTFNVMLYLMLSILYSLSGGRRACSGMLSELETFLLWCTLA